MSLAYECALQFLLETWWDSKRLEFHCVRGPGPKWRQEHNLLDPVAGPTVGNQRQTRGIREQICRLMRHIGTKWKMHRSEI
jgi:hypothetical protein